MTMIKTLWAMVQGDPVFMRRVNGWLTIFWILMIPVSQEADPMCAHQELGSE